MPVTLFLDSRGLNLLAKDLADTGRQFAKRGGMREPLQKAAHEVLSPSIRKNFLFGGRPEPWPDAVPNTRYRQAKGQGFVGGRKGGVIQGSLAPPLLVTGGLMRSASAKARWHIKENRLTYGNFPSTKWYAMVHDTASIAERADIPVRPFALIQEGDIKAIGEVFTEWVEDKVNENVRLHY